MVYMAEDNAPEVPDPNQPFYAKAQSALRELFEKAKTAHELHFAMALTREMRGMQDAGWNTAFDASLPMMNLTNTLARLVGRNPSVSG
jgi:hypothetical protein